MVLKVQHWLLMVITEQSSNVTRYISKILYDVIYYIKHGLKFFKFLDLLPFQKTKYHTKRIRYDRCKLFFGYYCPYYYILCATYICFHISSMEAQVFTLIYVNYRKALLL